MSGNNIRFTIRDLHLKLGVDSSVKESFERVTNSLHALSFELYALCQQLMRFMDSWIHRFMDSFKKPGHGLTLINS